MVKLNVSIDIYYTHSYRSFESDSNENNNIMIRIHIAKGENIDKILKKELKSIEKLINNYPRNIKNINKNYYIVTT